MAHRVAMAALLALAMCLAAMGCAMRSPATPQALQATGQAAPADGASGYHAIAFYLPNRLVDVLDVVSFGIGLPWPPHLFPASAHVNAHVTRAFQLGAGHTHGVFIGKDYRRRFTWMFEHNEFSVGPLTVAGLTYRHTGAEGEAAASLERAGMLLPGDEPFAQGLMDYWAVGANVGLLVAAAKVEVHLGELLDALAGFLLFDPAGDDL
ncbi:MAG TPA: hypothetical protein PLE19_05760 [Planctomycetota bacterium]|nr:hypothetical protein [Planctomycetota bacterium]HRR81732.1 hypothetical protein [Planctomycetota bacterium]HRT96395.1 hypothetical protein [Planctomycetota bacterium]